MPRREPGSGTVYFDQQKQRWIGAVTVEGRRRKVTARTKTAASARLRELVARRDLGVPVDNRRTTVADLLALFLERDLPNRTRAGQPLAPATLETYAWAATVIRHELGPIRLADLTTRDVEDMLDRLAARGLSAASLRKIRGTLRRALAFSIRRGETTRNPATAATLPAGAAPTSTRHVLEPDDARRLLAQLHHEPLGALYALGLRLGLRPGEAAGLYWHDLDLEQQTVNVTRGLRRDRGHVEISDQLKTSTSARTLALPDDVADLLRQHRARQLEQRLAADQWHDARLVFTGPTGRPLDPAHVRRDLVEVCQRAEVPVLRPNELRHTAASLLADLGVPLELVADLLGHSSTRMLEQTYRHRLRPVIDVARRADWTEDP